MTIHATMNPVGSTNPKDLIDNAQNLDYLILGPLLSYPDRRGVNRLSWAGIEAAFAAAQAQRGSEFDDDQTRRESEFDEYQARHETEFDSAQTDREAQFNFFMDSSGYEDPIPYAPGIDLPRITKTVLYLGNIYRVRTEFMPLTTTNWATDGPKLKLVGDDSLRQDLASILDPSKGAGMVGWARTQIAEKVKDLAKGLNTQSVSIWECAHLATGYVAGGNMATWDMGPAINAASDLAVLMKAGIVDFTAHRFNVTTTIKRVDGVSFRGRGSGKRDTSGATLNDVTTIANTTNANVVMESLGKTSGQKNIIAHMTGIRLLGNTSTTIVLDLLGFWLSKFDECFIGGGLTTVWGRSDVANGYNCYYNQVTNSLISGLNPNNYDNTPNVYGLRLTDLCAEFYMDAVNILNASNALSIESGAYMHGGYVNVEYSSINHKPIFIDSPSSVIADLRCDPHREMTTPFLQLGVSSTNNRIHLKTFEQVGVVKPMSYYFSDLGKINKVTASVFDSDYAPKRNLLDNPNFIETSAGVNYGWSKTSASVAPGAAHKGQATTRLTLTSATTLASVNALVTIPVGNLSIGDLVALDLLLEVNSPAAMLSFSDSIGTLLVGGSINGQALTVENTAGKFERIRRMFVLTSVPVGFLRLNIYPSRSSYTTITPTIGDNVRVGSLCVDVLDPYSHGRVPTVAVDGGTPMLNDLTFRKPGAGIVLTTPDGAHTYRLSISNAGALVSTQLT